VLIASATGRAEVNRMGKDLMDFANS
jgi:hypothetical protein